MAKLFFTNHLRSVAPESGCAYSGNTVGAVLSTVFDDYPRLQHYILDDQGQLRKHVVLFVDERQLPRDSCLDEPVARETEIYIMQALSGGDMAEHGKDDRR